MEEPARIIAVHERAKFLVVAAETTAREIQVLNGFGLDMFLGGGVPGEEDALRYSSGNRETPPDRVTCNDLLRPKKKIGAFNPAHDFKKPGLTDIEVSVMFYRQKSGSDVNTA